MTQKEKKELFSASLFLSPYFVLLFLFLIFPFLKGIWISLHDWDLLKALFNPESKKFIAFDNYIQLFWGENLTWSLSYNLLPRLVCLSLIAYAIYYIHKTRNLHFTITNVAIISIGLVIVLVLMGIHPSEIGRWNDLRFWNIVNNTFVFVLLTVPLVTLFSLLVAAMLQKSSMASTVLRIIFFTSNVLSVTVVTLIWQIMYSPQQGMIANIFTRLGLEPLRWVTSPSLAMPAIVIVTIWWSLGFAMIIFIAALQDIPKERYEAAQLDGAKKSQVFLYITVPGIIKTIALVLIIEMVLHFQVFGQSHLITQGGPGDATQVLVRYIYQTGFRDSKLGYAAALSTVLFIVMMLVALLQFKILRGQESEE